MFIGSFKAIKRHQIAGEIHIKVQPAGQLGRSMLGDIVH